MGLLGDQIDTAAQHAAGIFYQQRMGDMLADRSQIMAYHHDGSALGVPVMEVFPQQCLALFVEGGVRFVEQQQRRFGQAQASEQGALQLASRQRH